MLRRSWDRLIRKQWLILYPLSLGVINTLAFFAVYAASGNTPAWNDFFSANFYRYGYVQDHFISSFSWSAALGVAIFAGLAVCGLSAMIRAPYFRAIGGLGYPLAPRGFREAGQLTILYLLTNVILWLLPQTAPDNALLAQVINVALFVIVVLIAFADYVLVFEGLSFVAALRRSFILVRRRWISVTLVMVVFQLVYYGLDRLYDSYYSRAAGVFILLPVSQLLVEAFLVLVVDLILIFMYQASRRGLI